MNAQIASHLNIIESAIKEIQEWANVIWVRFVGGCRFVSKKVIKMANTKIKRSTWKYGDNYELWIDGKRVESWSTKDFTVNGFIVVFAKKYGLHRDEIEICTDVNDIPVRTAANHQTMLFSQPPSTPVFDPRSQSNDFDPDEF